MNQDFSFQKVHDILEVVNDSLKANDCPTDFYAIFNGQVYQHGDVKEILGRLYRTFPEAFTEFVIEDLTEKMEGLETPPMGLTGDHTDPREETYWSQTHDEKEYGDDDGIEFELGKSALDMFKESAQLDTSEPLDRVQEALSILNKDGLIDGDGNVLGRDLKRVLKSDLGLGDLVNFAEVDWYLDDCCGNLLKDGHVTIGRHESNGRTRTYNFLNSPFKLY